MAISPIEEPQFPGFEQPKEKPKAWQPSEPLSSKQESDYVCPECENTNPGCEHCYGRNYKSPQETTF